MARSRLDPGRHSGLRDRGQAGWLGFGSRPVLQPHVIIDVAGTVSAGNVIVRGGSDEDVITYGINADHAAATIQTFDGEDSVRITVDTDVTSLWINFGNDVDEFFSEFEGAEPFDLTLVNLP